MNNRYVIIFVTIMTVVVAVMLTGVREVTNERAAQNEDIFNKRAILSSVDDYLGEGRHVADLSDQQVLEVFNKQVEQVVVNSQGEIVEGVKAEDIDMAKERKLPEADRRLPVYIFKQGNDKYYILAVRGNGLWDEIWGNIALKSDLNTVAGAAFDHKGETPGLGAEIKDNPAFPAQFEGKEIYQGQELIGVVVRKGGAVDEQHEVDGISGATITGDGVTRMIYNGLRLYEPYLQQQRGQQGNLDLDQKD